MDRLLIDWEHMDDYIADPIEYRFIDKVEVEPGKEAWGTKVASSQDWYFKIHFPKNPVMPGVFIMEALMQTGVFIVTTLPEITEKLMMFHACESMRMYKSVRPGDVVKTDVILKSYRNGIAKYHGEAKVEDVLVGSMDFTLIVQSELSRITPLANK